MARTRAQNRFLYHKGLDFPPFSLEHLCDLETLDFFKHSYTNHALSIEEKKTFGVEKEFIHLCMAFARNHDGSCGTKRVLPQHFKPAKPV